VAVIEVGGEALEPLLPKHPLIRGVANAMIKMQNNLFTVEFLGRGYIPGRYSKTELNEGTYIIHHHQTTPEIHPELRFGAEITIHDPDGK